MAVSRDLVAAALGGAAAVVSIVWEMMMSKMTLPTDREVLEAIYTMYYEAYAAEPAKVYIPIDIDKVSARLGAEADLIFGRLYYHLQERHGYKRDDDTEVPFFCLRIRNERHCVHFPLMASVLASLREEHRRNMMATVIALVSLGVSIVSIVLSLN